MVSGTQSFETRLDFMVRDVDPDSGEVADDCYEDTYAVSATGSTHALSL